MTRLHSDPCFFILGYGRSGTTLFRRMLSAHPQLFVPPENDIFQRLPPVVGAQVADPDALDRVIAACPPYYHDIYDFDRFRAVAIERLPLSAAEVFVTLIGTARIADGKIDPLWGHKMPSEWPYIGTWRDWYPNARFLHLVRQPHDAVASMVEYQLQRYPTTPLVGIWQWRKAFRAIRSHGAALGADRYLMLRYEDLVTDADAVLGQASRFLGVSDAHVAAMIDYKSDSSAVHSDPGVHMTRTESALTPDRIGREGKDYSAGQTALLDYVCRSELSELGYNSRATSQLTAPRQVLAETACKGLDMVWAALRQSRRMRGQL